MIIRQNEVTYSFISAEIGSAQTNENGVKPCSDGSNAVTHTSIVTLLGTALCSTAGKLGCLFRTSTSGVSYATDRRGLMPDEERFYEGGGCLLSFHLCFFVVY